MTKQLNRITVDPNVCMGQPTIRGMRITVAFILKLMASGMTHEEILKAYPELEKADIYQTFQYLDFEIRNSSRPDFIVIKKMIYD